MSGNEWAPFKELCWQANEDQCSCWTPLHGPIANSSRAELLGATLAMMAPQPIHLASDSKVVVDRLQSWLKRGLPGGNHEGGFIDTNFGSVPVLEKSLMFVHDTDLWHLALSLSRDRGPSTFRISKVKAHLSLEEAISSGMTQAEWEGNAKADAAASRAMVYESQWEKWLFPALVERRAQLLKLVGHIQDLITDVLIEHSRLFSACFVIMPRTTSHVRVSLTPQLPEAAPTVLRRWARELRECSAHSWPSAIVPFLFSQPWVHAPLCPMPWLALLALFETSTGVQVFKGTITPAAAHRDVTVQPLVVECAKAFMAAVRCHVHPEHACMFIRSSGGIHALNCIGVHVCLGHTTDWPSHRHANLESNFHAHCCHASQVASGLAR